ncbi:MAG TPA: adenylate/guanylate cyclase domain-containing protein [Dongiaceae bacterium]|nr:adenylate/guanylate cyclase domain-containing protein [Dongiaceae bacterium]
MALLLRWIDPPILSDLRALVFDQYQRVAPREYKEAPVKIVDIDDESLARYGQWPWPRSLIAQLLAKLREQGAASVALDMVFAEPDRTSPGLVFSGWGLAPDDPLMKDIEAKVTDPDKILADEIARGRVVVGVAMTESASNHEVLRKAGLSKIGGAGIKPENLVIQFGGAIASLPMFQEAALGIGSINTVYDRDGIVRRVPLLLNGGGTIYPSLAAEALRIAIGEKNYVVKSSGAQGTWLVGWREGIVGFAIGKASNLPIKTDPSAQVWLRDTGHRPERYVPAWKVLAGEADLGGDIVFVGTSAPGLLDLRSTPNASAVPGVEVHAQIVEQILSSDFLERPLWSKEIEMAALLVLGGAMVILFPRLGPLGSATLGGVSVLIATGFGWWGFLDRGWLIDPAYPSAGALAVFTTGVLLSFRRSDIERKRVRETFSHYLAPAMVKRLVANPGLLRLGGEVRDLTIMFCDIRDFTSISEKMEATALTALLNDFLTPMTEAVLDHEGTIDKYIGDSIMAFWNAPLDEPDHARLACRATLEMRRRLFVLNKSLVERAQAAGQSFSPIMIGIGLNSGDALVGNLGARQRLNYSVIGDNVNLASRIEGVSKGFGLDILIGEQTRNAAPDFAAIPIGDIFVKGKTLPARLYALIGGPEVAQAPQAHELLDEIAKAAQSFKSGNLSAAAAALAAARGHGEGLGLEPLFEHMSNALASAEHKAAAAAE